MFAFHQLYDERLFSFHMGALCFFTWDVTKVPVDAEVGVRGDDATLKDFLANHRGEGVFCCINIRLNQPRVLWTCCGMGSKSCLTVVSHSSIRLHEIIILSTKIHQQGSVTPSYIVCTISHLWI